MEPGSKEWFKRLTNPCLTCHILMGYLQGMKPHIKIERGPWIKEGKNYIQNITETYKWSLPE